MLQVIHPAPVIAKIIVDLVIITVLRTTAQLGRYVVATTVCLFS